MEMVLLQEGLNFEKEVKISSRFIDFLLDGNIVVEIDGMHHYYPYYL